jgi:hypothetical protein
MMRQIVNCFNKFATGTDRIRQYPLKVIYYKEALSYNTNPHDQHICTRSSEPSIAPTIFGIPLLLSNPPSFRPFTWSPRMKDSTRLLAINQYFEHLINAQNGTRFAYTENLTRSSVCLKTCKMEQG